MAVLTTGHTFVDGQQVTSDRLNNIANAATFASAAVDGTTTQLSSGAIIVKDLGISTGKIAASAVTTAKLATDSVSTVKIADSNVTKAKIEDFTNLTVLGNVSGSAATPAEVTILDEDNMVSDSATSLATQQSIKAYADSKVDGTGTGAFTTLTASDDVNFDSGTLFVDASADCVGIGTTSPAKSLHVNENGSECVVVVTSSDSGTAGIYFGDQSDDIVGGVVFDNSTDKLQLRSSNNNTAVTIDNLERVGIGTTSPSNTLHVKNTTSSGAYINYDGRSNTEFGLRIESNADGGNFESDFGAGGTALLDLYANSAVVTGGDILVARTQSATPVLLVKGSGNVGIGDSSPSYKLDVNGTGRFVSDLTLDDELIHNLGGDGAFPGYSADGTSSYGTTGCVIEDAGVNGSTIYVARRNSWALHLASDTGSQGSPATVVRFADMDEQGSNGAGQVGSITITPSATAYNTSSDYRLKENNVAITDGIDRLKQLSPYRFNFKRDADTTVDGFFAHEVSDVVPEAITGTKDAMKDQEYEVFPAVYEDVVRPAVEATYDEEGNELTPAVEEWTESVLVSEAVIGTRSVPDYQGIDQSKLVPLLTAALQEAVAKIEVLEARVQTLEG